MFLSLAGCSVLSPAERQALVDRGLPPQAQVSAPFFAQEQYQCGPAALATLLVWSGVATTPESLTGEVYLPGREGSLQVELLAASRRAARIPYVLRPELEPMLREVAAGHPVLVLENLGLSWVPRWHYAVVIGYDLPAGYLTLHSGTRRGYVMPLDTFLHTWRRAGSWAAVVLPADRLPATADELPYVAAVADLERLSLWPVAEQGYRTALSRWPQSPAALLGLGNARYAQGDVAGAAKAFSEAVAAAPDSAVAHNNLASVLAEQGHTSEALAHARKAVELGGDRWAEARRTLEEVEGLVGKAR